MLKEIETEEKIGFFVKVLSLVVFQLGVWRVPWLRVRVAVNCY